MSQDFCDSCPIGFGPLGLDRCAYSAGQHCLGSPAGAVLCPTPIGTVSKGSQLDLRQQFLVVLDLEIGGRQRFQDRSGQSKAML